jgi:hypothetical protein
MRFAAVESTLQLPGGQQVTDGPEASTANEGSGTTALDSFGGDSTG